MDQESAASEHGEATPIFTAYRKGYDPDQVDRFVADQRRRLDDAQKRASDSERKLASAVGQLRELHRRVASLESEERTASPQPPSIDTLGERVQRILQEAWEGAYALRQSAEQEIAETKEAAQKQGKELIATARRKAEAIEEEIERRRSAYLERIEEDRSRAIAQMTYLSDQRKTAVKELLHVKQLIESTLNDVASRGERAAARLASMPSEEPATSTAPEESVAAAASPQSAETTAMAGAIDTGSLPKTMPVHRLPTAEWSDDVPIASTLVRNHRESVIAREQRSTVPKVIGLSKAMGQALPQASVFDFEAEEARKKGE